MLDINFIIFKKSKSIKKILFSLYQVSNIYFILKYQYLIKFFNINHLKI